MAWEVFETRWIKWRDRGRGPASAGCLSLVEARESSARMTSSFPYTRRSCVAERLVEVGCRVLMPLAAPIVRPWTEQSLWSAGPPKSLHIPLIVDAGIGLPSHAAQAMELGYDGILLNTAVAKAGDPTNMAIAFAKAIEAGRMAYLANPI